MLDLKTLMPVIRVDANALKTQFKERLSDWLERGDRHMYMLSTKDI